MRFLSSGFLHQSTPFGPLFTLLHFFKLCFEFIELFKFKFHTVPWATVGNQISVADTWDLKLERCKP
jgi:hypothetical protein